MSVCSYKEGLVVSDAILLSQNDLGIIMIYSAQICSVQILPAYRIYLIFASLSYADIWELFEGT